MTVVPADQTQWYTCYGATTKDGADYLVDQIRKQGIFEGRVRVNLPGAEVAFRVECRRKKPPS